MASTELSKTFSASNRKTWTFSAWIKFSSFGGVGLFAAYADSSNRSYFGINGSHQLLLYAQQSGSDTCSVYSTQVFRDPSAWYHIMCVCDTTQSTSTDRVKFYVNGSQADVTFSHTPDQNEDLYLNGGYEHAVGSRDGSSYFDGLMSHVHFADGTAYTPSTFGSTDTNGQWKINTSPTVTYGTNGFFILKDGNSVTDQSGNSNNFTVGAGTLTNTEDCPSNVFATWNVLAQPNGTLSNGNLSNTSALDTPATIGVTSGKYYWEYKKTNTTNSPHYGICSTKKGFNKTSEQMLNGLSNSVGSAIYIFQNSTGTVSYAANGGFSSVSYNLSSFSIANGDIVGCALDISTSSGRLDFYKNGSSIGYVTFTYDQETPVFPFIRMNTGASTDTNFGNGYFGTTAISSEGTNASGNGKFEYDVPTGYTALSTKGLNE
tara:strand:- start:797 stop:2089 length:1293 start_codon:yes stop_codon:yes gene_type:complete